MQRTLLKFTVFVALAWGQSAGCTLALDTEELTRGSEPPAPCTSASDCDDQVACTSDTCKDDGTCAHTADDTHCDRFYICDLDLGCIATDQECESATDCDDQTPCTEDLCQLWACYNRPHHDMCISGDPCILEERCESGIGCTPGYPKPCEQPDLELFPCMRGVCDSADGECYTVPEVGSDNDSDSFLDHLCGGDDCNDARDDVNPSQSENCGDLLDNNCDGLTDTADTAC